MYTGESVSESGYMSVVQFYKHEIAGQPISIRGLIIISASISARERENYIGVLSRLMLSVKAIAVGFNLI